MKILIIGGTKFIGKAIVQQSLERGYQVVLFNRGNSGTQVGIDTIVGDVNQLLDYKAELLSHNFDVVVHCIAYTQAHSIALVEVFRAQRTKLIVLSSCDCYEAFQGLNRMRDLSELPIDENSQLSLKKYYWSDSQTKGLLAKEYDKNLMTEILIEAAKKNLVSFTVFRLPMVYGPEDYQYDGRHGSIIRRILDKRTKILLGDREQCQLYTYGYIENIAAAIVHSYSKAVTENKIYNLGEEKTRSMRRWVELYSEICHWPLEVQVLPEEVLLKDLKYYGAPPRHMLIDSQLFRLETQFVDPISLREGVEKTFKYALENPNSLKREVDYEMEEKMINDYQMAIKGLM